MAQDVGFDKFLNMLAEKTIDNTQQLKRGVNQRRNGMEDLYGICFSANGDANNPASFYISLSPDYVYLQRFAFKFVIKPFTTTVKGATESASVSVDQTSLGVSGSSISPNPHGHGTQPHTHNVINGMAFVNTTSSYWRVKIAGIDITSYLAAQYGGEWISGEGIYPNSSMTDFYDILQVASDMTAIGEIVNREQILASEFKKIEIVSDAPFGVDAYLYLKYGNTNR